MGQIIWQIKQLATKIIAIALVGAVAFGGYSLYQDGIFRGGIGQASKRILRKVPYVGSRFKHFFSTSSGKRRSQKSISYRRKKGTKSYRNKKKSRKVRSKKYRRRR